MDKVDIEEGRYRILLNGIRGNCKEEKDSFCHHLSKKYNIPILLLKKIVDRCPIIRKKNLSLKKAEILAKNLKSFGASVTDIFFHLKYYPKGLSSPRLYFHFNPAEKGLRK